MKLGIMQPYFMPYIGYYSLIKHTDEFILFDPVQFIRHGWIERNRILKQGGGWQYIQIPLIKDNGRDTLIKDVRINNAEPWKQKMLAQLQHYKKKAPYYFKVIKMLNEIFAEDFTDITHLNKMALQVSCDYLGISREFPIFSEMNLAIDSVNAADEWALNICKAMGCTEYINPIGGTEFFDRSKYNQAGVQISFQQMEITEYVQGGEPFEPGLSMIDVMMFNSPEEINSMLDRFTLV
ncbi:MAG: WbqC family protein [Bacteroidales bacterium]|nr:WbqC family protein [Candidatus Colimorpha pelethequi]